MTNTNDITLRTLVSDGPAQPGRRTASVVVIHGETLGGRVDIEDKPVLVGRSQEADLVIAHKSVSRTHCRIWRDGTDYFIRDLGATNTTRLNDSKLSGDVVLADGDQITIGESILKFVSQDSLEARYHEEIYQLATQDPLTELYNRRHFVEVTDKELTRASRHHRPLALCIIDVDWFKPINDQYGHIAGDEVLRQIAALIKQQARNDDFPARIGGEEFALLLPECDPEAALACAERIRATVEHATFLLAGEQKRITVSIGVVAFSEARSTRSTLMAAADAALYRAKSLGRNRVELEP